MPVKISVCTVPHGGNQLLFLLDKSKRLWSLEDTSAELPLPWRREDILLSSKKGFLISHIYQFRSHLSQLMRIHLKFQAWLASQLHSSACFSWHLWRARPISPLKLVLVLQMQNTGYKCKMLDENQVAKHVDYPYRPTLQSFLLEMSETLTFFIVLENLHQQWLSPTSCTRSFRIRVQQWQVRRILRRRLGEERGPLLQVEHRQEELDGRWRLLQEGRGPLSLRPLEYHLLLCLGGDEQNRPQDGMARSQRPGGGGHLEMGRLQSLECHILGTRRTKQWRCCC